MMIHAWRITKARHAATAFTGGGAKAYGGRWNSPGTAVVYTAGSISLAILEMLVNMQRMFQATFCATRLFTMTYMRFSRLRVATKIFIIILYCSCF